MNDVEWTLRWQRAGVLVAILGATLLFSRRTADPFGLPKAAAVLVGTAICAVGLISAAVLTRRIRIPLTPLLVATAAFLAAAALATVFSDRAVLSLVGEYVRLNGLISYTAAAVLMLTVLLAFEVDHLAFLARLLIACGALVGTYAVGQWAGIDPIQWTGGFANQVFATQGNPDLAAATLAILLPFAIWGALSPQWGTQARLASGIAAGAVVLGIVAAGALQGPTAAVAAGAVMGTAWLRTRPARQRRRGAAVLVAGACLGFVVLLLWALDVGPLQAILGSTRSMQLRFWYWSAAVGMFASNPFTGVGLGRFAGSYHAFRPAEAAVNLPLTESVDVAHSVPLHFLAEGGLLLGLGHLAVVAIVGWYLITGLRRLEGPRLLLLGAFGGAWAAYQAQSLVSFDVPVTIVFHVVTAAAVVVLARPPAARVVALGGQRKTGDARSRRNREPRATASQRVVAVALGLIVLVLTALTVARPLRADMAAADARRMLQGDDPAGAAVAAQTATDRASWEPSYWFLRAEADVQAQNADDGLDHLQKAVEADPLWLHGHVTRGRLSVQAGEIEVARQSYDQALQLEPNSPQLMAEAALFHAEHGDRGRARELADAAAAAGLRSPRHWGALAEAYELLGEPELADQARANQEAAQQRVDARGRRER